MKKFSHSIFTTLAAVAAIGMAMIPANSKAQGDQTVMVSFEKNVNELHSLGKGMVKQARIDMKNDWSRGESPTFLAVSQHAILISNLVKACEESNSVKIDKAAVAVEKSVIALKNRDFNDSKKSRKDDPINQMILSSVGPAKAIQGKANVYATARRASKTTTKVIVEKKEGNVITSLLRKVLD